KIGKFPIIMVGRDYWSGLIDWVKKTMLSEEKNIAEEDLDLFAVVDTAKDAVEQLDLFYSKYLLSPNF
ncbi:MAG: LOG family protein, partial [Bacteroidales bacterium]|nr:LOG family protein [Bacteroidales bacterium]